MSKTTNNIYVEDFYQTSLTNDIVDTGDVTLSVAVPPINNKGFIIINPESSSNREKMYYSSVSGNTITVKGGDREDPKPHLAGEKVQINDTSLIFNYLSKLNSTTFYVEKNNTLEIKVWGGPVAKGLETISVSDTILPVSDGTTNFVYYKPSTNEIKVGTDENAILLDKGIITSEVITASGLITSVNYRHHKIFIGNYIDSIAKTSTNGLVDTYTINYTDGTNSTFDITNGNGISDISKTSTNGLIDTYTINYTDGTNSTFDITNGNGISDISKTSTNGLIDTYTIAFDNGNTSTFDVTNGEDAPEVIFEYSIDGNTNWHSTFTTGDFYIRNSTDNGITWSDGMKFIGDDGVDGIDGTKITTVTSSKTNKTTTVTVNGDFNNAPYNFDIEDGQDGTGIGDIASDITGIPGADKVTNIISLTKAEYDSIATPNPSTIYNITDDSIPIQLAGFEENSNKSTDITTDTGSDIKYPSVKAVEDYVNAKGISTGTSLPTASDNQYKLFFETDTDTIYFSNGTSWLPLN